MRVRGLLVTVLVGLFSCVGAAAEPPAPALDDITLQKLDEALACVNLTRADLGWDKRPISDDFRLSCVNDTLDHPLALADWALRAEREFGADPLAAAGVAAAWLDLKDLPTAPAVAMPELRLDGAPAELVPLLSRLVQGLRQAEALRERASAGLSDGERALIRQRGLALYIEESEQDWDAAPVLAAAKKIALADLVAAEVVLAQVAAEVRLLAPNLHPESWRTCQWTVDGLTLAVGGPGPDMHTATLVVDGGGDDMYRGGAVLVDLGGDDTYRDACSGAFACALLVELAGNDRYLGGNLIQGSAAYGASLHVEVGGDDRYEADQCSQGSGFFGVGMLFDLGGQDAYRGARFVQGFGGVRGLGLLCDVAGDDTYYAGGKYRHEPLLPENYQSLSQGFGFGLRGSNTSGGIGVLADHAGNDVYSAEVFAQGCSYWFALGILADSAGHDKYDIYHYGQGSGIHLSSAVLFDRAGNDAFSANNGVAQGCGHDWASGLLWDLAGDDYHQGSGMTHGGANANGIGLLIDRLGNDSYGGIRPEVQGWSFPSRGTIGLGLMLDLDGEDRYTTPGGKDNAIWTKSAVGVGLDWTAPKSEEKK